MNKLILGLALAGLGAVQSALAADVSVTVTHRSAQPVVGLNPPMGIVVGTLVTPTAGVSFDLPVPSGKTSNDILDYDVEVRTSSGAGPKPVVVSRSGATVTVSGSVMTSGTLSNGDVLKARAYYKQ